MVDGGELSGIQDRRRAVVGWREEGPPPVDVEEVHLGEARYGPRNVRERPREAVARVDRSETVQLRIGEPREQGVKKRGMLLAERGALDQIKGAYPYVKGGLLERGFNAGGELLLLLWKRLGASGSSHDGGYLAPRGVIEPVRRLFPEPSALALVRTRDEGEIEALAFPDRHERFEEFLERACPCVCLVLLVRPQGVRIGLLEDVLARGELHGEGIEADFARVIARLVDVHIAVLGPEARLDRLTMRCGDADEKAHRPVRGGDLERPRQAHLPHEDCHDARDIGAVVK